MNNSAGSPIITVPSWVIAGTYAENLRFLENKKEIDGVELLFFLYDPEIKKQFDSEWEEVWQYRDRFTFTAHLPELLYPAHDELIAQLAPLVRHFIIHPSAENPLDQSRLLADWTRQYDVSFLAENTNPGLLDALLPHLDINPGLCESAPRCFASKVPLCMDTGHLLLEGKNPAAFFTKHRENIKEIHLHGLDEKQAALDGKLIDHRRLWGNEPWLIELLPLLENYRGIINLEMFSWEEAAASIGILPDNFVYKKNQQ